jgi:hypothetical protein
VKIDPMARIFALPLGRYPARDALIRRIWRGLAPHPTPTRPQPTGTPRRQRT